MCTAEILEYLRCFTDVNTYPTSDIINKIMVDFIMKQRSPHVAHQSCRYLEQVSLDQCMLKAHASLGNGGHNDQ